MATLWQVRILLRSACRGFIETPYLQRCTEGVWLAVVSTENTLYIALDFEGLGSVERTPQEDMLLIVFNSAVSNLILYKVFYRS